MNLDDFKRKSKTGEEVSGRPDEEVITNLSKEIREAINLRKKQTARFIVMLVMLAVIYVAVSGTGEGRYRNGMLILASGFVTGAVYLYFRLRALKSSLYSRTTAEFLDNAARRMAYFTMADWLVVGPVLAVLGIGGWMVFVSSLLKYTDRSGLLTVIYIVFYLCVVAFGYFAGRKDWRKMAGDLYSQILKARDEMAG